MTIPKFDQLTGGESLSDLIEMVAKLQKQVQWLMDGRISSDNIRARSIETDSIQAGAITANEITVNELSAISANLGHIIAGLIDAISIFGSYIATSRSYPRIELNSLDNTFAVLKDALHALSIYNLVGPDVPAMVFADRQLSKLAYFYFDPTTLGLVLNSMADVNISGSSVIINGVNFNSKADKSSASGTVYVSSTPGGAANIPISFSNGVRTS